VTTTKVMNAVTALPRYPHFWFATYDPFGSIVKSGVCILLSTFQSGRTSCSQGAPWPRGPRSCTTSSGNRSESLVGPPKRQGGHWKKEFGRGPIVFRIYEETAAREQNENPATNQFRWMLVIVKSTKANGIDIIVRTFVQLLKNHAKVNSTWSLPNK